MGFVCSNKIHFEKVHSPCLQRTSTWFRRTKQTHFSINFIEQKSSNSIIPTLRGQRKLNCSCPLASSLMYYKSLGLYLRCADLAFKSPWLDCKNEKQMRACKNEQGVSSVGTTAQSAICCPEDTNFLLLCPLHQQGSCFPG